MLIHEEDITEQWLCMNDDDVRDDLYIEDFITWKMKDMTLEEVRTLASEALYYFYERNPAKLEYDINLDHKDWYIFYHTHQYI